MNLTHLPSPARTALLSTLTVLAVGCASSDPPYDRTGASSGTSGSSSGKASSGGAVGVTPGSTGTSGGSSPGSSGSGGGPIAGGNAPMGGAAGAYNVDVSQTSVSGISSGGYMAVQFHVAFSSIMKGAAVFAGGPFYCAQGQLVTAEVTCQYSSSAPSVAPYTTITSQYAATGAIDDPKNLASQRVFLFGGANDYTVNPVLMDSLNNYYASYMSPSQIKYESRRPNTGHTMPTLAYGGTCSMTAQPWIGNCGYDGAGTALTQIYGSLDPPATGSLSGEYVTVAQGNFLPSPASHSIADTGYAYVPESCKKGDPCKVHVAFHGCEQEAGGAVGDAFYKNAGYNPWADTNHIIVLYPQTTTSTGTETNPNACWDWWGYDSADYSKKTGPQMAMVRKMIDSLAGK